MHQPTNSSPKSIFTKRDLEDACRRLCEPIDSTLSPNKRRTRNRIERRHTQSSAENVGCQLKVLDAGVKLSAKKMNDCKIAADQIEAELLKKNNELIELARESNALSEMLSGENPESNRIRELKKELDCINCISEKKLQYRFNLRHMYQRLQKNSLTFDAHLSAMAETLDALERDSLKLKRMHGDIESAQAQSMKELDRIVQEVEMKSEYRQNNLVCHRNEASNAERMKKWRLERESITEEFSSSFANASSGDSIEKSKKMLQEYQQEVILVNRDVEEKSHDLTQLEGMFSQVKQATGVNTLTDLVHKIKNNEEQKNRLTIEKEAIEKKLSDAKIAQSMLQQTYSQTRTDGFGDTPSTRFVVNGINESIMKEKIEAKVIHSTNERLEKVLVEIRQGGIGLYQRLSPFYAVLLDGDVPILNDSINTSPAQAAHDTLEMLRISEKVLTEMLSAVGGAEIFKFGTNNINEHDRFQEDQSLEINLCDLQERNCRVESKSRNESSVQNVDLCYEDDVSCSESCANTNKDSSMMTRNIIKRLSEQEVKEQREKINLRENQKKTSKKVLSKDTELNSEVADLKSLKHKSETSRRKMRRTHPPGIVNVSTSKSDPLARANTFLTEMPILY